MLEAPVGGGRGAARRAAALLRPAAPAPLMAVGNLRARTRAFASTPTPVLLQQHVVSAPPLTSALRRQVQLLRVDSRGVRDVGMGMSQLRDESRLSMRDLLVLEQPSGLIQARILPRRHCIAMTVGYIRALVFTDRVYLFSSGLPQVAAYATALAAYLQQSALGGGAAQHQLALILGGGSGLAAGAPPAAPAAAAVAGGGTGQANGGAQPSPSGGAVTVAAASAAVAAPAEETAPFELLVMEHALLTIQARQAKRVAYAKRVLESLTSKMGTLALERDDSKWYSLFPLLNTITHYEMVSRNLCESIRALLDDDRDMREACLSAKARLSQEILARAREQARAAAAAYDPPATAPTAPVVHTHTSHGHHHHQPRHDPSDPPPGGVNPRAPLPPAAPAAPSSGSHSYSHHEPAHAEGSDAYLGYAPSPIHSHQHLAALRAASSGGAGATGGSVAYSAAPFLPAVPHAAPAGVTQVTEEPQQQSLAQPFAFPSPPSVNQWQLSQPRGSTPPPLDVLDEEFSETFGVAPLPSAAAPAGAGDGSSDAAAPPTAADGAVSSSGSPYAYGGPDTLLRAAVHVSTSSHILTSTGAGAGAASAFGAGPIEDVDDDVDVDMGRGGGSWRGGHHTRGASASSARPSSLAAASWSALPPLESGWGTPNSPTGLQPTQPKSLSSSLFSPAAAGSSNGLAHHHSHHGAQPPSPPPSPSPSPATSHRPPPYGAPPAHSNGGGRAAGGGGGGGGLPPILRVPPDALSQLELMLESVYHASAETVVAAVELGRALRSKTELLGLLELQQSNYHLSMNVRLGVFTASVSCAAFITSAWGMNLASGLEATPGLFYVALGGASLAGAYVFRWFDRFMVRANPATAYARRLEAFQSLLYKLDVKLDAAKTTLGSLASSAGAGAAASSSPLLGALAPDGAGSVDGNGGSDGINGGVGGGVGPHPAFLGSPHMSSSGVGVGAAGAGMPAGTSGFRASSSSAVARAAAAADRRLTKGEFRRLHEKTTGRPMSSEEADLLFELLDADADGQLKLEEALTTYDTGSGRTLLRLLGGGGGGPPAAGGGHGGSHGGSHGGNGAHDGGHGDDGGKGQLR